MMHKLVIPGTLMGLNAYISAERSNRILAARIKRDSQEVIAWYIKEQLDGPIKSPVHMRYTWVEPNKRRDKDNIAAFGRKVIQDALVATGILQDDGWKHIEGFADSFAVDKDYPRVEVEIEEVG